jgi:succinate dehydrogenase / fumarate reductase cytochrome b subunit
MFRIINKRHYDTEKTIISASDDLSAAIDIHDVYNSPAFGVALASGSIFLVWWLVALAYGGDYYQMVQGIAEHVLGRLVLLGFYIAVSYHMANGIRHLFWDFGIGLSLDGVYRGGYIVIGFTALSALAGIAILFLA